MRTPRVYKSSCRQREYLGGKVSAAAHGGAVDQGLVMLLQGWGDRGGGSTIVTGLKTFAVQQGD